MKYCRKKSSKDKYSFFELLQKYFQLKIIVFCQHIYFVENSRCTIIWRSLTKYNLIQQTLYKCLSTLRYFQKFHMDILSYEENIHKLSCFMDKKIKFENIFKLISSLFIYSLFVNNLASSHRLLQA